MTLAPQVCPVIVSTGEMMVEVLWGGEVTGSQTHILDMAASLCIATGSPEYHMSPLA
jgi:hypothetical protein